MRQFQVIKKLWSFQKNLTWMVGGMLSFFLAACSTPQNIEYFQDAFRLHGMLEQQEELLRLRPQDKINIVVSCADPVLEQQFTLMTAGRSTLGSTVVPQTVAGKNPSSVNGMLIAYTVDNQGDIHFPELGRISVVGKTRSEVAAYIAQRLKARELVFDPIVTVEFVNMGVDVLGEVVRPGRIDITSDRFTIINAISRAGDLTINGKREEVLVTREVDGQRQVYRLNLCDMQELLLSPAYYLRQDDIVYVPPTRKRMREADSAGNTFQGPGFWISLASLLATITALIIR